MPYRVVLPLSWPLICIASASVRGLCASKADWLTRAYSSAGPSVVRCEHTSRAWLCPWLPCPPRPALWFRWSS